MNPELCCQDERRREKTRAHSLNGLDYVEAQPDQKTLHVYFLGKAPPKRQTADTDADGRAIETERLGAANIKIEGGQRIQELAVVGVDIRRMDDPAADDYAIVTLNRAGDFSTYTLRVAADAKNPEDDLLKFFDLRYTCAQFNFHAECPRDLDCRPPACPPPPRPPAPDINYLSKDYRGFRQLLLDRLAVTVPDWRERSAADLGVMLVEVLAYAADHLSYHQDAVAMEAYLATARRRISVRRHARLVDYVLHEGCNARTYVCLNPAEGGHALEAASLSFKGGGEWFEPLLPPARPYLWTGDFLDAASFAWELRQRTSDLANAVWIRLSGPLQKKLDEWDTSQAVPEALLAELIQEINQRVIEDRYLTASKAPLVKREDVIWANRRALERGFEASLAQGGKLHVLAAHAELLIHTWGDARCCLERGATRATLVDEWLGTEPEAVDSYDKKPLPKPKRASRDSKCEPTPVPPPPPRPRKLKLREGDVLIFEEVLGPKSGLREDADPRKRHAVRLTRVWPAEDGVLGIPVVRIEWAQADALPFSLCLSTLAGADAPGKPCALLTNVTVARGNVVLCDHGRSSGPSDLGGVPLDQSAACCRCEGDIADRALLARDFAPKLPQPNLTFAQPFAGGESAAGMLRQKPWCAIPAVWLQSLPAQPDGTGPVLKWTQYDNPDELHADLRTGKARTLGNLLSAHFWSLLHPQTAMDATPAPELADVSEATLREEVARLASRWEPRLDLLASAEEDRHFVVEMDDDRVACFRFGAEGLGRAPAPGEAFRAHFRLGNGPAGNMGQDHITSVVGRSTGAPLAGFSARNPLAAIGGQAPESLDQARRDAPQTFRRKRLRAITAADYAELAGQHPAVQRAAAELRWTGARPRIHVAIDARGVREAPGELCDEIKNHLMRYRRIGHEIEVLPARLVPVEIEMRVCAQPHALRGHVLADLLDLFTSSLRRDGTPGLFHPDSLTFGEPVRVSLLVATAQTVSGVDSVVVEKLCRQFEPPLDELANGLLPLGPLEVARCDNDPNFPEHGVIRFHVCGGR